MVLRHSVWVALSVMSMLLLAGQAASRAHAAGEEYLVLAAHCQAPEGGGIALVLIHRLFESDLQTLAATVRGAIQMVPGCNPVGGDGFIALDEAQKMAVGVLPKPTQIFALLPGPIVDFGPILTRNDGGRESYRWAVGYRGPSGDHSAWPRRKILSPLSAILTGSWRCFNSHHLPVSVGIVSWDLQSCDLDQRTSAVFAHITVDAVVFSIEDGSRFFGGDPTARRALANEMKRHLADWPEYPLE